MLWSRNLKHWARIAHIKPAAGPSHTRSASFCFWPTSNPAADSHLRHLHWALITARFSQEKTTLNTLETRSALAGREELPRSIPARHLPTPATTVIFQKSN